MGKPARIHSPCSVYPSRGLHQRLQQLVLRLGPTTEALVEVKQYVADDTFAKQTIVGHPAFQPMLAILPYVRQFLLTPILPWPAVDLLPNAFRRLLADDGKEKEPLLAPSCLDPAWPECVAEKVKGYRFIVAFVPAPFAVCDLCLGGMERQAALVEPVTQQRLQLFGFALAGTMTDNIVGISLELNTLPVLFHPHIKHIVQEQVCQ